MFSLNIRHSHLFSGVRIHFLFERWTNLHAILGFEEVKYMRPVRAFCVLFSLLLLFGCTSNQPAAELKPAVDTAEAPALTPAVPETIFITAQPAVPSAPTSKAESLLYAGEDLKLYSANFLEQPGICVEALLWGRQDFRFQPLPGLRKQKELTVTGIEVRPDGDRAEAYVCVRYLDDDGAERMICADHSNPDYTVVYPLSDGPDMDLSESQTQSFDDLLMIGYLYESIRQEKSRLSEPESWEKTCQSDILYSLYYKYNDALPPYLTGEGIYDDEYQDTAIIAQTELEAFFQSCLGRPYFAPDRSYLIEEWSDLLPGQITVPPSDYCYYGNVKQAVAEADGTICLYGYIDGFELLGFDVICRIHPVDGYLGGQVDSTEIFACIVTDESSVSFVPFLKAFES